MINFHLLKKEEKSKHKNIKNPAYRQFLDKGLIDFVGEEEVKKMLSNIKHRHLKQARSLVICLYYTGARPNEVLRIKGKDVTKERGYIIVQTPASKNGLPRPIYLPFKKEMVKEFYKYVCGCFNDQYIFFNFMNRYKRRRMNKKGEIKERIENSARVYYWVNKWSDGKLTPYFLRHNRFSKLSSSGITMEQIRMLKGSKTYESVTPYLHLSSESAKKVARKME